MGAAPSLTRLSSLPFSLERQMHSIEELRKSFSYNPDTGCLIRVSTGKQAGSITKTGYMRTWLGPTKYKMHRVAWAIYHGEWPDQIDHINGDRADNRIDNLRNVSKRENSLNHRLRPDNKSGCPGVNWHASGKWIAQIRDAGKYVYLGSFANLEDAVSARKEAEARFGYHKNHGTVRARYERD